MHDPHICVCVLICVHMLASTSNLHLKFHLQQIVSNAAFGLVAACTMLPSQSASTHGGANSSDGEDVSHAAMLSAHYVVQKKLGQGGFGSAFHVVDHTGAHKVVKVTSGAEELEDLQKEYDIMEKLRHPHLAHVYGIFSFSNTHWGIEMDYYKGGDLAHEIIKRCTKHDVCKPTLMTFHRLEMAKLFQQVLSGIVHLHSNGVVHRDIKPPNILFRGDGIAVLADLGIASWIDLLGDPGRGKALYRALLTKRTAGVGTPGYMAPELDCIHDKFNIFCFTFVHTILNATIRVDFDQGSCEFH